MTLKIESKKMTEEDLPRVKNLFTSCKWSWLESDSQALLAFKNSYGLYFAYAGEDLIGFGRLLI